MLKNTRENSAIILNGGRDIQALSAWAHNQWYYLYQRGLSKGRSIKLANLERKREGCFDNKSIVLI